MKVPSRPERDRDIFKVLRALRGITNADIARQSYIAAATVKRIRTGETKYPRGVTLRELCRIGGLGYGVHPLETEQPISRARVEHRMTM